MEEEHMIETGTISAGTMQPRDLIPAFMDALIDNGADKVAMRLITEYQYAYDWASDYHTGDELGGLRVDDETLDRIQAEHPDAASELVIDLFDALDAIAPDGMYFGSLEGNGCDYGFWEVIVE